ncbi:hypothetical protein N5U06_07605 [Aliarcobacter butzleri]|uniref:tetratricopeptide repeat protein n=1 Tax=Aliarcobacter butzleri TaxID=28197 RepID=UPI0021B3D23C|nr:hypothetical protein [Aliarcobacter butzleri]MCT7630605.1 hypothetical protein [Aliarcobacter butzleri]
MKFIFGLFLLINVLIAQQEKDFYYSFIDSNGQQIPQKVTQTIVDGLNYLQYIRSLAQDGKTTEAFSKIKEFKDINKTKVLYSDIMILYSELALKNQSKKLLLETSSELEKAINASLINQQDLLKAYMILVDLKLGINKIEDAKYFSKIIIDNFDDELTKTYGKISLSKVYKYQKDYDKATKTLFEILSSTKDKQVATVVGNELFDIYLLQNKTEEAKELMTQILKTNMAFYINDVYLANKKIDIFAKLGMIEQSIELLQGIIANSKKDDAIEDAKYKLANIYMQLYDKTDVYLDKAKVLYKDILDNYPKGNHIADAQMYLDEILMRQNILIPNNVAEKYTNIEDMQQKALLQELINNARDKKYEEVLKVEKVYKEIPSSIFKRFGYDNVYEILDNVYIGLIRDYLSKEECSELNKILKNIKFSIWQKLVDDEFIRSGLINCVVEVPSEESYTQIKNIFSDTKDANIYLVLETMAYSLNFTDDALYFSSKIEAINDKKVLEKEFLYKYQVIKAKNDFNKLDRFLKSVSENEEYISQNENNPIIIDFYHDYYGYLLRTNIEKANEVLKKLYDKQNEFKAFVYSPLVESDLSKIAKKENKIQEALNYLLQALEHSKRIKPDELARIYYEILSLYDNLGDSKNSSEYLQKCKDLKNVSEGNLYKKMCDTK